MKKEENDTLAQLVKAYGGLEEHKCTVKFELADRSWMNC